MTTRILAQGGDGGQTFLFIVIGVAMAVLLLLIAVFARLFAAWFRALSAGARISLPSLIAMRLRGSPIEDIIRLKITAAQAGIAVDAAEIERAYMQGANIELAMQTLLGAKEAGRNMTWDDVISSDLEMWLSDRSEKPEPESPGD